MELTLSFIKASFFSCVHKKDLRLTSQCKSSLNYFETWTETSDESTRRRIYRTLWCWRNYFHLSEAWSRSARINDPQIKQERWIKRYGENCRSIWWILISRWLARTRAHTLLHSWEYAHLAGINFITNKLNRGGGFGESSKYLWFTRNRWIGRRMERSIDRKCPTIEVEKKVWTAYWIARFGAVDEWKQDRRKLENATTG